MRALMIPRFGDAEVLTMTHLKAPVPGPEEVTIDVAYAGVNYAEVLFRKGGVPNLPLPFVPGIEVSGTIREIGEKVTGFRPGQQVAALTIVGGGGYAEVVKVPAELVFPLGEAGGQVSMESAAAFPSNVTTAYMILTQVARVRHGETVLVHAAAGGVGSAIGQVAKALGAGFVIGTVGSADKLDYAKGLGYDEVYLRENFEALVSERTGGQGVDVVVDPVGGLMREASMRLLKPLGKLIAMGNASDAEDVRQSLNELWFASKTVSGFNLQLLSMTAPQLVAESARKALALVAGGKVKVDVTGVLPLHEAGEAHRLIEDRKSTGKLVLEVGSRQSNR
ncbi:MULTISPECIES: zinc-binding dehydrogenase [unclassified Paenibacillus]|uniref:quinone oxidoreductase family protein n=1 Tax=unclassified Paenibacillus TaxID=185978 RepID=UPI00104C1B34|nr:MULTISPECIES: zinc-binding dehydrogenase [unclassified Paenibacillus]NIK67790.1 NADPH2:quinone reductase [Paenibacillus sp. BK720]TCN01831.1 NADPH2:quinone reductase [Paenibacillus sp. BK033]